MDEKLGLIIFILFFGGAGLAVLQCLAALCLEELCFGSGGPILWLFFDGGAGKDDDDDEIPGWGDGMNDPTDPDYFILNPINSDHLCNIYHSDWLAAQDEDGG